MVKLAMGDGIKKGMMERDGNAKDMTPMKRDRGYETCPDNPTSKLRGTNSPVSK